MEYLNVKIKVSGVEYVLDIQDSNNGKMITVHKPNKVIAEKLGSFEVSGECGITEIENCILDVINN